MPELATQTTLDIVTRAVYKYRLVTRGSTNMLGAELLRLNMHAIAAAELTGDVPTITGYERQAFPRKVKRNAIDGALRFWLAQVADLPGITESAAFQLVAKAKDKNDDRLGIVNLTYGEDVYEWDEDLEEDVYVSRGPVTRTVGDPPEHSFWNVADEDRDTVMIRDRETREAEQRAVLEARMAERQAAEAAREAERSVAQQSASAQLAEDLADEDEWEDDDDEG